jgi:hypothetical protein
VVGLEGLQSPARVARWFSQKQIPPARVIAVIRIFVIALSSQPS